MISAFAFAVSAADVEYSFTATVGEQPVNIDVTDDGTHITWTIDYPLVTPYDEPTQGTGSMVVGLVIALDGDGEGPAFQIHNNDGCVQPPETYPWGTWLMSPWGSIDDGSFFGWHSSDPEWNTLVSELDWVSCTGERYNDVNPDGVFTISIDKSVLGNDFHWALNLAIGSGFYSTYLTYEQMACPQANPGPSFNWATPLVDDVAKNYEYAELAIPDPDATVTLSATVEAQFVSINVDTTTVGFGTIVEGESSSIQTVTVINTGNVDVTVTADIDDAFYQDCLKIDGAPYVDLTGWELGTIIADKTCSLQLVDVHGAGTHSGTLVFWAIASP